MSRRARLPRWDLYVGDCRHILPRLPRGLAAAGVWDPPAGLGFMDLDWDRQGGEPFADAMAAVFRLAAEVLQPGAWVAVWGHPQTSHWTSLALARANYVIETKVPWINAEAKPQPERVGRLAPGHEEWIIARTEGPRRPLSLRAWRDAVGGRQPRGLLVGSAAAVVLDSVVGQRRSGRMNGTRRADKSRNSYGANKGSKVECFSGSDGGPSRFFVNEGQLLVVYGARARHRHRELGPGGPQSEHPTKKSVELLLPLVDLVAGDNAPEGPVLDIFAGSGTVGEAAMLLGRDYVGIELGANPRWPAEAATSMRNVTRWYASQSGLAVM